MKKRFDKKGYFFLLDSILALTILAVALFVLFSDYQNVPVATQAGFYSSDILDYFANTEIKEVNNPYAGIQGTLWQQGVIDNEDHTLLQQLGEIYRSGNMTQAELFIGNLTTNRIPSQYEFEIWMDDQLLYPRGPSRSHNDSKNNTNLLLPSRNIVHGFIDEEQGEVFGPYEVEVFVWQAR